MKAIAAVSINGVIGQGGKLPWNLPVDLKRFKDVVGEDRIVMGRTTFESLPRILPNRDHIVLTRNPPEQKCFYSPTGNLVEYMTKEEADQRDLSKDWLIGGRQIYTLFADKVTDLHLTLIVDPFKGDTRFPWDCYTNFELAGKCPISTAKNGINYCFLYFRLKDKK